MLTEKKAQFLVLQCSKKKWRLEKSSFYAKYPLFLIKKVCMPDRVTDIAAVSILHLVYVRRFHVQQNVHPVFILLAAV